MSSGPVFTTQFQHWYPQYGNPFNDILHLNCSNEYAQYRNGVRGQATIDWLGGGDYPAALTQPVIQCILDNSSEYLKAMLTGGQVMLGITPTILALLGASNEELAMLTIVARRPILAWFLALGSPSVYLSRAFEYHSPQRILEGTTGRLPQWRPTGARKWVVTIVQYGVAMGAVANIGLVSHDLGLRSVSLIWSDSVLGPMVWAVLVLFIHMFGIYAMHLRVQRHIEAKAGSRETRIGGAARKCLRNTWRLVLELLAIEVTPSAAHPNVQVTFYPESMKYIIVSWAISAMVISHLVFGTFLLSSQLFIGPRDALGVAGRYMASTLSCRIIIMYEIAGIRETYLRSTN